jgi:hypothetical protein
MTPSSEELESFRWTLLGMYLCIVGGLCLLLAVHVHLHRPLPHELRWDSKRTHLVPFCSSCNPDHKMCVDQALPDDTLDVRFALLTVNESRRICSNYKLMDENLNMH